MRIKLTRAVLTVPLIGINAVMILWELTLG